MEVGRKAANKHVLQGLLGFAARPNGGHKVNKVLKLLST